MKVLFVLAALVFVVFQIADNIGTDIRLDRLEHPTTTTTVVRSQGGEPSRPAGVSQRIERLPDGTVCIRIDGHEVLTGRVEAERANAPRCKP